MNSNPYFYEKEDDQPNDVLEKCYNDMFAKDYNQQDVLENSIVDCFQEYFSWPIYDEYRNDYLVRLYEQPTEDLASSWSFIRKNQITYHDHNIEN